MKKFRFGNLTALTIKPIDPLDLPNIKLTKLCPTGEVICQKCDIKASLVVHYKQRNCNQVAIGYFAQKHTGLCILMTVDHVLPVSLAGADKISNLRPLCALCNIHRQNLVDSQDMELIQTNPHNHISEGAIRKQNLISKHPVAGWIRVFNQFPELASCVRFS